MFQTQDLSTLISTNVVLEIQRQIFSAAKNTLQSVIFCLFSCQSLHFQNENFPTLKNILQSFDQALPLALLRLGSIPAKWKEFALLCTHQWKWEMNAVTQDLLLFVQLSEFECEFLKWVICWLLFRLKEHNTQCIYGSLIIPSLLWNYVLVTIKCFACVYLTKYLSKQFRLIYSYCV